jgi:hypothetical protein
MMSVIAIPADGGEAGADARIRTGDLRITNALLYQLSYTGLGGII